MARWFIPKHWRLAKLVWILLLLEGPLTVANLTLFGIASPDTYRTKLWKEGGAHGWNSDPSTILYAYANYRPVKTPVVWSSFNTQYNMYMGVFTMFLYLVKFTMWIIHVWYPIISLPLNMALVALWSVSIWAQSAPDTIDPKRANHGAPWYVTKSCSVSSSASIKGYCMQAKAAFAVSIVMLVLFVTWLLVTIWSLYPTTEQRIAHETRRAEKKAEREKFSPIESEMSPEQQWQHVWELQQLPRTPGTGNPMLRSPITPRTKAFGDLNGSGYAHTGAGAQEYYGREVEAESPVSPVEDHAELVSNGKGKSTAQAY